MSQHKKLEQVLDLLLSENSEQAAEILHQIIVEKARVIYEGIVSEEDAEESDEENMVEESDEVGGDPEKDFTDEIGADKDEVSTDEENDGEADTDDSGADDEHDSNSFDDEMGDDEMGDESTEERVDDLESQLADLRAEFDALMGEEMQEPEHADMADDFDDEMGHDEMSDMGHDEMDGIPSMGGDQVVGEVAAKMYEKKKAAKLEVAKQTKKVPAKGKKAVEEETQFLNKVADTGQRGTAKLVGTGKGMTLGAEQNKSPYTSVPARKDYGGKPAKIGGGSGGEYGKFKGTSAEDKTITDNVGVEPKKHGVKADTTSKFTGGKPAGSGFNRSPLSKKP